MRDYENMVLFYVYTQCLCWCYKCLCVCVCSLAWWKYGFSFYSIFIHIGAVRCGAVRVRYREGIIKYFTFWIWFSYMRICDLLLCCCFEMCARFCFGIVFCLHFCGGACVWLNRMYYIIVYEIYVIFFLI